MASVLVTVVGPQGPADFELPVDVPIQHIIPLLLAVCAPRAAGTPWADPAYWGLGPLAHGPFAPARTLVECDVVDGATLIFQDRASWMRADQAATAPARLDAPDPAGEVRVGAIGIRWNKDALLS
jgi:hypothetical protein